MLSRLILLVFGAAAVGTAQPVVHAVENNYSFLFPGLPNYGIAQGSIFALFGSNFAAEPSAMKAPPLQTSLNGVSVQANVNGVITQALLYYVTPTQIGGILPSNTPEGTGTITVFHGGAASQAAPIVVVKSAFGILTSDGSGAGPAAAFDANATTLSARNSVQPGEVISLWGTGLGPITRDESTPQPGNLPNLPIEVDIGGVPATVLYHGRSSYPGLDQINVTVPGGATGCWVSVVVRTGDLVSNSATIPVAASGRQCSDPPLGPVQELSGKTAYDTGYISATQSNVFIPPTQGAEPALRSFSSMNAEFEQVSASTTQQIGYSASSPSPGSCIVRPFSQNPNLIPPPPQPPPQIPAYLDAGPAVNFVTPDLQLNVPVTKGSVGIYSMSSGTAAILPLNGGTISLNNGSGGSYNGDSGSGVGGFALQFYVPPPLVWSNLASIPEIDRSKGLTVTWTGGDPNGIVLIGGESWGAGFGVQFFCSALISQGQFTVPASILLAMPAYEIPSTGGLYPSFSVNADKFYLFDAPGLDAGLFTAASQNSSTVPYK